MKFDGEFFVKKLIFLFIREFIFLMSNVLLKKPSPDSSGRRRRLRSNGAKAEPRIAGFLKKFTAGTNKNFG